MDWMKCKHSEVKNTWKTFWLQLYLHTAVYLVQHIEHSISRCILPYTDQYSLILTSTIIMHAAMAGVGRNQFELFIWAHTILYCLLMIMKLVCVLPPPGGLLEYAKTDIN